MPAVPRWAWVLAGALVLFLGAQWFVSHRQDAKADADVAQSIVVDASHKVQTAASARVDTAVAKIGHTRKTALDAADATHAVADTLGQHAQTVRDSLNMWHSRDSAHVVENDSLRRVIRSDSLQRLLLVGDRDKWKLDADTAVASQGRLRDDLVAARSGCRILPFVPCLSRKQTAIVGLVAGAVIWAEKDRLFHR